MSAPSPPMTGAQADPRRLLHNYRLKVNEEVGRYKREKVNISIGDELHAGVLKRAKVYVAAKRTPKTR